MLVVTFVGFAGGYWAPHFALFLVISRITGFIGGRIAPLPPGHAW
jgi:hypothetical protein